MNKKPAFKFTPLSFKQIQRLAILAKQAYYVALARRAIDDTTDSESYRKAGQLEACGIASLKECNQSHFLQIRAKWFVVIGNLEEAFNDLLNAGPDAVALSQLRWRFVGQIALLADGIHAKHLRETGVDLPPADSARRAVAYAEGLSKDRFEGRAIKYLGAGDLEQLGFTITNRANAYLERGSPENRNKKQRLPKAAAPAEDSPEGESFMDRAKNRLAAQSKEIHESGSNRL